MPCERCNQEKTPNKRKNAVQNIYALILFILLIFSFFISQELRISGMSFTGFIFFLLICYLIYLRIENQKYNFTPVMGIVGVIGVVSIDFL